MNFMTSSKQQQTKKNLVALRKNIGTEGLSPEAANPAKKEEKPE